MDEKIIWNGQEYRVHRNAESAHQMELRQSGEVVYLVFPEVEELGVVRHMMSTRLGGVSSGDLGTLNLSFRRGDDPERVTENFRRAAAVLDCVPEDVVCSFQTHTVNVRRVTTEDKGKGVTREQDFADVDGLITNEPGILLSTSFADCVPLLIVDPVKHALGLSHSGWRGTVGRMGAETIRAMEEAFGSRAEDLVAAIGPSICQKCYEVSEDVAAAFRELFITDEMQQQEITIREVLEEKGGGKYQLNLWKANEAIFRSAGVKRENIVTTDICTCCNPDWMFSHRASGGKRGNLSMFAVLEDRRES